MIKDYYRLTKPGIIRANVMTAAAGFLFASRGSIAWIQLLWLLLGTTLVIAAGCVTNNILDRSIDSKMKRTRERALVTGRISLKSAAMFALITLLAGSILLYTQISALVAAIGVFSFFSYVVLYGLAKRHTNFGTEVGTVPGAGSIVAGYAAALGRIDLAALILFLIMVFWQMPHFYAIALFRSKEYAAAKIPVLPLVNGRHHTWLRMVVYGILFGAISLSLALTGYAGAFYLAIMLFLSAYWLALIWQGKGEAYSDKWAKQVFGISLIVLLVFSAVISLEYWLP